MTRIVTDCNQGWIVATCVLSIRSNCPHPQVFLGRKEFGRTEHMPPAVESQSSGKQSYSILRCVVALRRVDSVLSTVLAVEV